MTHVVVFAMMVTSASVAAASKPEPGVQGRYAVLTCKSDTPPPFETVDLTYGPSEAMEGTVVGWFQIQARAKEEDVNPALEIQMLMSGDPLGMERDAACLRYLLRIGGMDEALEYRNVHTGRALLPTWARFEQYFLPRAARGSAYRDGLPETATYLGQVLTLTETRHGTTWKLIEAKRLDLDPELLVGTARNFKDAEGHRLPQTPERKDYTYVRFGEEDYATMIAAGSNIFTVAAEQERYVRDEPVFYIRVPSSKAPLRWPADFYRSNYLGSQMFMDEPAIITVGDNRVNRSIRYFTDFVAVLQCRVDAQYASCISSLDRYLGDRKVNLGNLHLEAPDCPVWETLYETAFYQMAAGGSGIVHEGRYRLDNFKKEVAKRAGVKRDYMVEEMLCYYYGTLRGGARPFGKSWGTAIYGQCDPKISPTAVTQAYDMGARYIWFWTSDHEHHLPWNEQMELTRILREHAKQHPRPSITDPQPARDLAIVLPYGYFISLESLWFIRGLDSKGENEAAVRYRRLLTRAFQAVNKALDRHEDFDITVDEGRELPGYKRIIRINDDPRQASGQER